MSIDDFADTPPEKASTPAVQAVRPDLTVSEAVDWLCGDLCAEAYADWKHARAGQREASHHSRQLAHELRIVEDLDCVEQHELDALNREVDNAARLVTIRTSIADEAAIEASEIVRECPQCRDLVGVLFPGVLSQADFGGEQ